MTNFLLWFLGVKSFHSHYKPHQAKTTNKHRQQKSSTCFIQQLGREHTPNEQVIPLTKYQRTVNAENQSLAKGDDVTSLVERILQPEWRVKRVNWKWSRTLKTKLKFCYHYRISHRIWEKEGGLYGWILELVQTSCSVYKVFITCP